MKLKRVSIKKKTFSCARTSTIVSFYPQPCYSALHPPFSLQMKYNSKLHELEERNKPCFEPCTNFVL